MDWDQYFMSLVFLLAMKSKDKSTHVGAVVVADDNTILATGYNSFPRGCQDHLPERQERPEKYFWFEHAERNAIYNAARKGHKLEGSRLYTNGVPCMDCARGVVQAGIKEVIVSNLWENPNWVASSAKSLDLFKECGIMTRVYSGPIVDRIDSLMLGVQHFPGAKKDN
jgi:dCMP deaminase